MYVLLTKTSNNGEYQADRLPILGDIYTLMCEPTNE